ncbi:hypothetical protein CANMA_001132 [Candida margitis]|uniref:uncharacterized protein n=1 Tax=Candida margitis TaxID=1775924 RepID=UPI002225B99C|nr:uncharacterized protein CANMA_001132 [Candida margitis]KAI5969842.1 hypothetical protein CANMA_001132 [Candida margitis]
MERVYTALSLSLITNKRLAICCDNTTDSINHFVRDILQPGGFDDWQYTVIDLLEHKSIKDILHHSTIEQNGGLQFKSVIIWQNLQHLDEIRQKELYKLILEIDHYNKNSSKCNRLPATIKAEGSMFNIAKPQLFTIILFLEYGRFNDKMYPYLKEMFWSSVTSPLINEYSEQVHLMPNYQSTIVKLRSKIDTVYMSPNIKSYIYSLLVFIRCHRLASLAPKSVRVPTATVNYIQEYCKSLVLWRRQLQLSRTSMADTAVSNDENELEKTATAAVDLELEEETHLFVTPEYVKIAMRNIGYWLVDWETNRKFANTEDFRLDKSAANTAENEKVLDNKKLEISMLTGDWYGSEYYCANELLKGYKAVRDYDSPTGMSNRIVDDAMESVRPPL